MGRGRVAVSQIFLIVLRLKNYGLPIVNEPYVELEFDVKFNEKVNDVFLSKSTSNLLNGTSGVRLSARLWTDARDAVHR